MAADPEALKKPMHPMVVVAVAVHIALLAAYTLPTPFVPTRVRYWSQAYSRVLFHQDWRLFAPDPPECGCSVEYHRSGAAEWQRLEDLNHHFIWRRMSANACRYAEATTRDATTVLPRALSVSLVEMIGRKGGDIHVLRLDRSGGNCREEYLGVQLRPNRDR